MIAAIYVALTFVMYEWSYTLIQFRVAEALTVLPFFIPAAVPGLFVGVLLANIISPYGLPDMIVGSAATLIAAILTLKCRKWWLAPLPPIVINGLLIGALLYFYAGLAEAYWIAALHVTIGQTVVLAVLGVPLMLWLRKSQLFQKVMKYEHN
jgi:uncharacterized membrane protein